MGMHGLLILLSLATCNALVIFVEMLSKVQDVFSRYASVIMRFCGRRLAKRLKKGDAI